ncbi:MAG: sigma-70 family RNA polymerase sigma factor [Planctomycetota bacterium]
MADDLDQDTDAIELVIPEELRQRLQAEPSKVLAEAFSEHRGSFWYLIKFRIDRRLIQRVDPEDVLQEAFLSASGRVEHFLSANKYTLFAWLRMIVIQTLVDVHRRHLGTEKRSAEREIRLGNASVKYPQTTSFSIAGQIAAAQTSPSGVAVRGEALDVLDQLIGTLSEQDQEMIAMRHFENLSNKQVAEVLSISVTAASNRYVRALERLKTVLESAGVGLPQ